MGIEVLSEKTPVAKKNYECMACEWLNNSGYATKQDLTEDEWMEYKKAESKGFKISIGETYILQNNKFDGDIYTFKAIPEIHDICIKYDLYCV